MQSDQNISKTKNFREPTTYEPHGKTSSDQIITFARQEYGLERDFIIKTRLLVQKG